MKRSWFAAAAAALVIAIGTVGAAAPATAAPPDSDWEGSASADVVSLTLTALGIPLTDLGVATSATAAGTTLTPQASSASANLSADVLGLGIGVVENTQTAPPTTAPTGLDLLAVSAAILDLGALTSANEANWTVDTACVTDGVLASADTQIAGIDVLGGTVEVGAASVNSTTRLVLNSGANYGVQSIATGSIAGLSLLNEAIGVEVIGTPILTGTSTGTSDSVTYAPATVEVTVAGETTTLTPGVALPITVGTTQVSITVNEPPATTGTASAAFDFLSISIDSLLGTDVTLGVLPLSVDATAPAGGIDCPPPAPIITAPANGSTTADSTPDITGTALPGATVTVTLDGAPLATPATADGGGNWSLTAPTLADGSHIVSATQTVNGQTSPASADVTFAVDTTPPPPPVVVTPANGSITNDNTPTISGTAVAGSIVTVSIDGAPLATAATADAGGNWSLTAPTLPDGSHTVNAVAADAVGNTSPVSNTNTFTVDTTAPPAPVVVTPANGSVTTDNTPTISGTAVAGSIVTVSIDGAALATTATADAGGNWSLVAPALADGTHSVNAVAADAVGNTSPVSNTNTFTVDTTAPPAPVVVTPANGSTISDSTPTISGTAEANATITVSIDGTPLVATTAADAGGNWALASPVLADGPHTVNAIATDAAGNISPVSNTNAFIIDTEAPAAPVILSPETGDVLGDATPTISGTAEANSTVTVIIDDVPVGTAPASDTGAWTFTPTTDLADGAHTVVATATDAAGNVSPESDEVTFEIDTEAPAAPVILSPETGDVLGDATPTISGTAEANSTVTVIIDDVPVGTAPASDTGAWTFTPTTDLADGAHTVVATATDAAGNVSPESDEVTFEIDTDVPDAPIILSPETGDVLGDATPTISGTAEANSTVTVIIDDVPVGTAPASDTGAWTFTPTTDLADGAHTVVATATDAAGNVSPESDEVTFEIDTEAPAAPVILSPETGDVLGDATPTISGTAEANSTVTVIIDDVPVGTAPASDTGAWTFTPTTDLADGAHTVVATATDAAGNVSPESDEVTFEIDTEAPAAPVILSPENGDVLTDATPTISGTAEANSTVTVIIDDVPVGTAPASDTGAWTFTPTTDLADGPHTVVATATDAAGNVSPESDEVTFEIDTDVPDAPIILSPETGDVLGDATPTISGTAEANSTVTVIIDDVPVGTAPASDTGAWTFTPTTDLADGPHTVVATATDAAGNVSPESDEVTFEIDTEAPAAPVILSPENGDVLTDATPTISGTAEANSTVTVIIDDVPVGTAPASDTGAWTFTPATPLPDGDHTVTATATDAAGNVSPPSEEVSFRVDATAPAAPSITSPEAGETVNDPTPAITGTAEPGSTVTVIIDDAVAGMTTAGDAGAWTFTPAEPLDDGDHTVSATATDAAGNVSPPSAEVPFAVDTTPPAAPIITSPAQGSTTDDPTPPIIGTAEPGSTVTVIIDDAPVGTTTADGNGAWTFTPSTPLGGGAHTITATATDAAGNTGPRAEPITVTIAAAALPDVQLTLSPATQTVASGSQGLLTATVRNVGTATATGVVATVEIPAGFTNYSGVATSWPDGRPQPPNGVVGSLTFAVGELAPGQSVVYRISGTVSAQAGSTLTFTATAVLNETDAWPADNTTRAQIAVGSAAGLPATGGPALGALLPVGTLLIGLGLAAVLLTTRRRTS